MMFTPWGPSAVPTGGAGVACPAGTCSFTTAAIGLAIGSVRLQLQVIHLHEHVPGIDLALHRHLLAVLDLDDFLRRDEGLADRLLLVGAGIVLDPPGDERPHLVLVPRRRLNRVPAMLGHQKNFATATTKICCSNQSIQPMSRPSSATKITMTVVAFLSSSHVGQVTLRI